MSTDTQVSGPGLVGLFLGAGASYELGMPLVWPLTYELTGWLVPEHLRALNAGWQSQGAGLPAEVIDDLAAVLARTDMHYESILGYLQTQATRFAWLVNSNSNSDGLSASTAYSCNAPSSYHGSIKTAQSRIHEP